MCSTFKFLAAAAVLERQQKHKESLQLSVIFGASDVVANSPITQARTGGAGMTLAELCEAAITMSDNTAGNLLLARIGGPPGLTAFARRLGDPTTRLDRIEPALNEARPGDPRDTTTPAAMLGNMHTLLIGGDVLTSASQSLLGAWLAATRTGDARIRARLPQDWRVGDKTGSGNHGSTNDIAILWPPGRGPILACIYLTESSAPDSVRNAALAAVGGLVAASL
jgi:beta-lactamase class A